MEREIAPRNTLSDFSRSLNPNWKLKDWFDWPPDLFALTSLFLKYTGAYRYAGDPPALPWPRQDRWAETVSKASVYWLDWLQGARAKLPELVTKNRKILSTHWRDVSLDRLSSLDGSCHEWDLCQAMLELHALADCACSNFGHPFGTDHPGDASMYYHANMLLATTGSLSRLPKHKVLVLPKMRTPRVGMTLRSLSLYVTAHQSEVEVIWRSMPWINIDENTVNIMVVPWPYEVKATWFNQAYPPMQRTNEAPSGYFQYTGCNSDFPVARIVEMVKRAQDQVHRVHAIVFPELALAEQQLDNLKWELATEIPVDCMPMIISGVAKAPQGNGSVRDPARLSRNQVVLSTYFAGRWYDLAQDKHHRWKLDPGQIEQYKLGGVLTGEDELWEAIQLTPRRITFLAPNGWLALCPLICEDLARLEPVSDLIRGVGPTLAIAILLDGPQLQARWPGRYASVLADDPGTSVLTVSALGMVMRSRAKNTTACNRTVALWKDLQKGWKEIDLADCQDSVLLTVAAKWTEEHTADGRGDKCNAGLFTYKNDNPIELPLEAHPQSLGGPSANILFAKPLDIEELTWFTFLVDAALDLNNDLVDALCRCAMTGACDTPGINRLKVSGEIRDLIAAAARQSYDKYGSDRRDFRVGIDWLAHVLKSVDRTGREPVDKWSRLVDELEPVFRSIRLDTYRVELEQDAVFQELVTRHELARDEIPRIKIYSSLAILWAVHKRLTRLRRKRKGKLSSRGRQLLDRIETLLQVDYRSALTPKQESAKTPVDNEGKAATGAAALPAT